MKKYPNLTAMLAILLLAACDKNDDVSELSSDFQLYIDFWNPDGSHPEISFDEKNTSNAVRIDFDKTFGGSAVGNTFTEVEIDNFRIIDNSNYNYEINSIRAYEYRDELNDWKEDVEFRMEYETIEDLAVVLVLDRSESLGEDFENVKQYASDFVTQIFAETDQLQVGVVDFADDVNMLPLTSNASEINNYISNLAQGRFTTLYEAVNMGINALNDVSAEAKAVIIFTDGTDNNSNPEYSPQFLASKIRENEGNSKIISFTIGLEGKGGVDRDVLNALSLNGGVATFPNSVNQLQRVFENFSSGIANVYKLTYTRNRQPIPKESPVKLRFNIQTKRK
ncbi:Ca-activated chloride channel family protein [Catalinimonas alkaloidigena]|uniref:vWA domain-containing protein n=1 Tax=Catalinimonas alkaloidigena TaxID=1075417 RepID=UPI002405BEB4|nr:VWA domain-containing protein [Catalinimonas alkaloidigena]MDF9796627.1 Ca-activated chloride channel family protein [Catalinimonas alkaloidigena]